MVGTILQRGKGRNTLTSANSVSARKCSVLRTELVELANRVGRLADAMSIHVNSWLHCYFTGMCGTKLCAYMWAECYRT